MADASMLTVRRLGVAYSTGAAEVLAVSELDFELRKGEILAVVGESGSGKTSAALAALNYLPRSGRIASGDVLFDGRSLLGLSPAERRKLYGRRIAHVSQDPSASLNPALKIRTQLTEGMRAQLGLGRAEALRRAADLLQEVHIAEPAKVLELYPHQLSGGMQQRVCIAMALACDPDLMVMDEPTTGLDAATEAAIFSILRELRARRALSVLFISHNLAAVRSLADRVLVMYAGRGVEIGPTAQVFERPAHRYTSLLIRSLPTMRALDGMPVEIPWQGTGFPASGCPFRNRCDLAQRACEETVRLESVAPSRLSACVLASELLTAPAMPPLLNSLDDIAPDDAGTVAQARKVVLEAQSLDHAYRKSIWAGGGAVRKTLNALSLSIREGEVFALIGESGSGKTTFARCVVGLESAQAGRLEFEGYDLTRRGARPKDISRRLQIVFQNIAGSLHPGKLVRSILARPFQLYDDRKPEEQELLALIQAVGLKPEHLDKRSPALSGGERQRVALARATASLPSLVVLDEAFSALDVSMKVKVMRLLQDKRAAVGMSMLLITHDLPIVRFMADRVAVLYRGWLCESGPRSVVQSPPMHPYTETLVWSAMDLEGLAPMHLDLGRAASPEQAARPTEETGCPFRSRCPRYLGAVCDEQKPSARHAGHGHTIACHIPVEDLRKLQHAEWQRASHEVAHAA